MANRKTAKKKRLQEERRKQQMEELLNGNIRNVQPSGK